LGGSASNTRSMRAIGALCRDAGLRVMEAGGWTDRGRTWGILKPEYVACHHTAAAIDIDRVLIDGRADLPGPLCNFALHGDDTVVLIASGLANHAGVATISSTQAYGIEATGPSPAGASGPSAFPNYDAYIILVAAVRLHHGWGNDRVVGHKEIARPLGRKINPSFDMDTFRAAVDRRVRTWGTEEDDMGLSDDDKKWITDRLEESERRTARWVDHGDNAVPGSGNHHEKIRAELAAFKEAAGARFDALEELLTPEPPA
jgi:hypothetical protein